MKRVQMVVEVAASLHEQPVLVQAPKVLSVNSLLQKTDLPGEGENNHEHIDRVEDAHETEAHDCDSVSGHGCT